MSKELSKDNYQKVVAKYYLDSQQSTPAIIKQIHPHWVNQGEEQPSYHDFADVLKQEVNSLVESYDSTTIQEKIASQAILMEQIAHRYLLQMQQSKYVNQIESFLRIALKSIEQSRKLLLALNEMKNPKRTAFIK